MWDFVDRVYPLEFPLEGEALRSFQSLRSDLGLRGHYRGSLAPGSSLILFGLPDFASFLAEIGSDWGLFSFTPLRPSCRFGTLFSSGTIGPFGGWDLGASPPQRGRSLGQLRAWSVPPALSAVVSH